MGKRSTTSTKSGKFMNPTDQARKEQRKKELKKNKKQRMAVRTAVLKGKDAQRLMVELDEVDDMELNPSKAPPLGEKVIKDKRRKLIETLERVLRLYRAEEPEYYKEVKQQFDEYTARRRQKEEHYEEVKTAERVTIDDIPMPEMPLPPSGQPPSGIPLPSTDKPVQQTTAKSILKRPAIHDRDTVTKRKPPGPPPGPPPPLTDSEDEEENSRHVKASVAAKQRTIRFADDDEAADEVEKDTRFTIRAAAALSAASTNTNVSPLQAAMLKMAGQKAAEAETMLQQVASGKPGEETYAEHGTTTETPEEQSQCTPEQMAQLTKMQMGISTGAIMFRGPGGAPVIKMPPGTSRPPGMPPGPPPGPPPGLPPSMRVPRLPMGMPPRLIRPLSNLQQQQQHMPPGMRPLLPSNVLSAPPSIQKRPNQQDSHATISAKPQIKHVIGDVTRFTPTALKVKRDDHKKVFKPVVQTTSNVTVSAKTSAAASGRTKDDAYESFMKEMQGIM